MSSGSPTAPTSDGEAHPLRVFAPGLFAGRRALVTGGGRGIGRAVALGFAELGARVVIASRKPENLESTAEAIRASGGECLAVPTDIRDLAHVDRLVERVLEDGSEVDFLVNNAGGQFPAPPTRISDRGWRAVVDLNLNGTWNLCSRLGPRMARRGFGAIVNVIHVYSFDRGAPMFAHSGAARAGVLNLTRTLAYYWARHGVTVNAIAPGTVDTLGVHEREFSAAEEDDFVSRHLREIPAHRMATPEEVAAAVAFLCSPAARYVNGTSLVVDGGLYLAGWLLGADPERL